MPRLGLLTVALAASAVGLSSCREAENPTEPRSGEPHATGEGFPSRGEVRTGYILGRNGQPLKVTYEVHGEEAVFEGDIILGRASEIATSLEQLWAAPPRVPGGPSFGIVIDGLSYRWPGGVVAYEIDPALPSPSRVTGAIAHIEANIPGVDLVPRAGQTDYVRFSPSTGCSSFVGRIGGMQPISLATGCSTGITVHEITHALGVWHEQSRCDRNSYVEILWANIQPGKEHNFNSYCDNATDLYEYAEGSLMHYGRYDFSANGLPTIRSLRGLENLMGNRSGYGTTDVATISQIYPAKTSPWAARSAMPTARKQLATGVLSGVLYAIGGSSGNGSTVLTKVEVYNPSSNAWATKAALPAARWRTNGAPSLNGVVYVAGGIGAGTAGPTKTLYAYRPSTNTWSTKAPMPVAGGCGGSWGIGGILYVVIGCDVTTTVGSGAKGILLRYDPVANTWATKTAAPSAHQFPGVAGIGGRLYLVGGKNSSGVATNTLHVYDPATNTWSTKAPLPSPRYNLIAYPVAGKLYAVGGNDASNGIVNTVYIYDPATNAWSTGPSMPTARAGLGGGTISGVLYALGGSTSPATALGTHEAFTP